MVADPPSSSSSLPPLNDSDYDYEDYYTLDALTDFGPCDKRHVRWFARATLPVLYGLECALGLVANGALALVFVRCRRARRVMPACAALADALLSLALPFWAVYAARDWTLGRHACKLVTVAHVTALYAGNLAVGGAALRVYADSACARWPGRGAAWCACVWLTAALATAPHLSHVDARDYHGEGLCVYDFEHAHGWRTYVRCQLIVLGFVVPFGVAMSAALLVWREGPAAGARRRLALGLTGVLFVLWFPFTVVNGLHLLQELHLVSECGASGHLDLAIQTTETLAFTRVFVHPVVYVALEPRSRRALADWCRGEPRQYLLRDTDSAHSDDSDGVELRALHNLDVPEYEWAGAEREGHFLPQSA